MVVAAGEEADPETESETLTAERAGALSVEERVTRPLSAQRNGTVEATEVVHEEEEIQDPTAATIEESNITDEADLPDTAEEEEAETEVTPETAEDEEETEAHQEAEADQDPTIAETAIMVVVGEIEADPHLELVEIERTGEPRPADQNPHTEAAAEAKTLQGAEKITTIETLEMVNQLTTTTSQEMTREQGHKVRPEEALRRDPSVERADRVEAEAPSSREEMARSTMAAKVTLTSLDLKATIMAP